MQRTPNKLRDRVFLAMANLSPADRPIAEINFGDSNELAVDFLKEIRSELGSIRGDLQKLYGLLSAMKEAETAMDYMALRDQAQDPGDADAGSEMSSETSAVPVIAVDDLIPL
mmetsp:Transcript_59734/g.173061  ORF Transcript_59734/g.173061 Transcript_59734/m.173061 type:complete len:113 (+) Transcript_59734:248-586(+)